MSLPELVRTCQQMIRSYDDDNAPHGWISAYYIADIREALADIDLGELLRLSKEAVPTDDHACQLADTLPGAYRAVPGPPYNPALEDR